MNYKREKALLATMCIIHYGGISYRKFQAFLLSFVLNRKNGFPFFRNEIIHRDVGNKLKLNTMKNLITVILMILSLTTFAQTEKLEGKWISESESTDGEIIAYEFENNETLKMYFDGKELPTKKPIEYKIIENKNRTEIEIEYVSPWNNSTEKMYGLIEFLKNGKIKIEFFPFDEQVGKKNEFSKEAVIFKKV